MYPQGILYYLHLCSNVKTSVRSSNELFEKLDYVNDPSIPPCALVLIESFKVVISELKVVNAVNKRISVLEEINANSINTTDYLNIENVRLNDALIKLQDRVDHCEQRNRYLCLLMHDVKEKYRNNENTEDLVAAAVNEELVRH